VTRGSLQRLGQGDVISTKEGSPTTRLQALIEEWAEHLEDAEGVTTNDIIAALAAMDSSTGLLAQTGASTFAKRTLTAPAAGLTITNPAGTAGNPAFALANDLAGLEGLTGTGLARRTGTDTWSTIAYDEGSFTPGLSFGGSSTGIVYTTQAGVYRRVGGLVAVDARVAISNNGSGTGSALITGLPFTSAASSASPIGAVFALTLTTVAMPMAAVASGTTTIALFNFTASSAVALTDANIGAGADIRVSVAYPV
jgi:hypothetical protein